MNPPRPALEQRLRALTDSAPGAALGALVYAVWATAVNWEAGPAMALRTGALHWLLSALLTYYGTASMRLFFQAGRTALDGAILAFVSGLAFTYAVLIGVHGVNGTPQLALTLAAGVIPNLLFCGGYALLLLRSPAPETPVLPAAKGL